MMVNLFKFSHVLTHETNASVTKTGECIYCWKLILADGNHCQRRGW